MFVPEVAELLSHLHILSLGRPNLDKANLSPCPAGQYSRIDSDSTLWDKVSISPSIYIYQYHGLFRSSSQEEPKA